MELKIIEGETYPVRDQLKALGARWNPVGKLWQIRADRYDSAMRIVQAQRRETTFAGTPVRKP